METNTGTFMQIGYRLEGASVRTQVVLYLNPDAMKGLENNPVTGKLLREGNESDLIDELVRKRGAICRDACENGQLIPGAQTIDIATDVTVSRTHYTEQGRIYASLTWDAATGKRTSATSWDPRTGQLCDAGPDAPAWWNQDPVTDVRTLEKHYPAGVHTKDICRHPETGHVTELNFYNKGGNLHDPEPGVHAVQKFDKDGKPAGSISFKDGVRLTPALLPTTPAPTTRAFISAVTPAAAPQPQPLNDRLKGFIRQDLKPHI